MPYIHYLTPVLPQHLPDRAAVVRLTGALFSERFFVPSAGDREHEPVVDQLEMPHLLPAPMPATMAELLGAPGGARAFQAIDFARFEHAALKETPRDPLGIEDWHDRPGYFGAYEIALVRHTHEAPHVIELNPNAGDRFACASCGVETATTEGDAEGPTFPLGARCGCGKRLIADNLTQDAIDRSGFQARRVTPILWRFALVVTVEDLPPEGLEPTLDENLIAAVEAALGVKMMERGQWNP